jgi:hypothetical protein
MPGDLQVLRCAEHPLVGMMMPSSWSGVAPDSPITAAAVLATPSACIGGVNVACLHHDDAFTDATMTGIQGTWEDDRASPGSGRLAAFSSVR